MHQRTVCRSLDPIALALRLIGLRAATEEFLLKRLLLLRYGVASMSVAFVPLGTGGNVEFIEHVEICIPRA